MKKVVKFGGSSLADAKQFKKAGDIVRADSSLCSSQCTWKEKQQ